jgi:long-chain acyl-CoA synthetase
MTFAELTSTDHLSIDRIIDHVYRRIIASPNAIAWYVVDDESIHQVSYHVLGACINHMRSVIRSLSIDQHEVLTTSIHNNLCWACIDLACQSIGIIHASIDVRLPSNQQQRLHELVNAKSSILNDQMLAALLGIDHLQDNIAIRCDLKLIELASHSIEDSLQADLITQRVDQVDEVAALLHTSGSTGAPKFIALSHGNLVSNAFGKLDAMPQFDNDVRVNVLPFSHAYARTCEYATWAIAGGSIVCAASSKHVLSICKLLQPTLLNAVPKFYRDLMQSSIEHRVPLEELLGGRLRMIASGGAGLSDEVFNYFKSIGLPIHQGYGLTEAGPVICSNRFGEIETNTVGPPIKGTQVRLDSSGQLHALGPGIMQRYWNDVTATALTIDNGWLATGDIAEQLSNGHYRIIGRIDDQIALSNGYKCNPTEIEAIIRKSIDCVDAFVGLIDDALHALCVVKIPSTHAESMAITKSRIHEVNRQFPTSIKLRSMRCISSEEAERLNLFTYKSQLSRLNCKRYLQSVENRIES